MTSLNTRMIAAERQRERIPTAYLLSFEDLTSDELAFMAQNHDDGSTRAYAGWELEYREAFSIEVEWESQENPYTTRQHETRGEIPVASGPGVFRIVRRLLSRSR